MIATATDLANDSKRILDDVIRRGETAEIKHHGKGVALIQRKVGVSGKELLRRLKAIRFTDSERNEIQAAIAEAGKSIEHGGRD